MFNYLIITALEQLKAYKKAWDDILEQEKNTNPFIEYEWISTWWATIGQSSNVEIYVVMEDKEAIAFFPLMREEHRGIQKLTFLADGVANYMDIVVKSENKRNVLTYLLNALFKKEDALLLQLHGISEESATSNILELFLVENGFKYSFHRVVTPYLHFDKVNFQQFMHKRRKKHGVDRSEKKLERLGNVQYYPLQSNEKSKMFGLFESRWKKKIDTSGFASTERRPFFEALLQIQNHNFKTEVDALRFEQEIIAFAYGFSCRGRYVAYTLGFDSDFSMFGPGRLIDRRKLLQSYEEGEKIFDFSIGYEKYKFDWHTDVTFTRTFIIAGSNKKAKRQKILLSLVATVKEKIKQHQPFVKFKRDILGKLIYNLRSKKEWLKSIFSICQWRTWQLYELEKGTKLYEKLPFEKLALKSLLNSQRRAEAILLSYQGFELYGEDGSWEFQVHKSIYRNQTWQKGFELPSTNSVFIDGWQEQDLERICRAFNNEAIYVISNMSEWKKRRALKKMGFKNVGVVHQWKFLQLEGLKKKKLLQKEGARYSIY
ncbi:GNAT family N-acetyltransferase [Viridibacillus arvi]|uniref:GNAT family N-acetyltransferase n=1 Tax=Viridibacillus arvi TaxID=263475 RepID=UPI0036746458